MSQLAAAISDVAHPHSSNMNTCRVVKVKKIGSRLMTESRSQNKRDDVASYTVLLVEYVTIVVWSLSTRDPQENRLHLGRALTLYNNAISRRGIVGNTSFRSLTTVVHPQATPEQGSAVASPNLDQPQRIKFKRLDKTAKHIMNILDKEAVEKVRSDREIPDIRPGYIIQMKVEVPENKRRVSSLKGIVIAKRNAGLNSTFRLRRLVAGVGVESVFPLYSPNIKEIKVVDKKKVRRAKLYYLRDRMNALKK